jgi:hypothetical protein
MGCVELRPVAGSGFRAFCLKIAAEGGAHREPHSAGEKTQRGLMMT